VSAAELVDSLLARRALIYGSTPPQARDLDLLVREPEERVLRAELPRAGFASSGAEWVRFAACSADIVELTGAASWSLPAAELVSLFEESVRLDGMRNLARPSPHHTLLILARRVACGDGVLSEKLRARLEGALGEHPQAWAEARARASAWSAPAALQALEQSWRTGARVPASQRAAARRERPSPDATRGPARARLRAVRRRVAHRRLGGTVIAFSGLDGAGKSSQALALCETLERIGRDAIVVRTRIRWDDSLWSISEPIKRLLAPAAHVLAARISADPLPPPSRALAGAPSGADRPSPYPDAANPAPEVRHPVTRIREQSPLLTDLWTMAITFANAALQWRLMRRALLRGAIVICDRYTLDSIVELRYSYGSERPLRSARGALRLLYPRPKRAYFLDVSPQAALERKGEWGLQWLTEHRELYLQECERGAVRVLDGERPVDELCAEIAREVWLSGI
jgi:thymidylate kinase